MTMTGSWCAGGAVFPAHQSLLSIISEVQTEELTLIEKVTAGDMRATRQLYDQTVGRMTSVCSRYIRDTDTVCDILQESYIDIFTHISNFKYLGEGSLQGWMARIVANKSVDYIKKYVKNRNLITDTDLPDIPEDSETDTYDIPLQILHQMIQDLPLGYRTIFNMYVMEQYDHKEIARILGIKESSSASQLHRAKKMLAQRIREYQKLINEE